MPPTTILLAPPTKLLTPHHYITHLPTKLLAPPPSTILLAPPTILLTPPLNYSPPLVNYSHPLLNNSPIPLYYPTPTILPHPNYITPPHILPTHTTILLIPYLLSVSIGFARTIVKFINCIFQCSSSSTFTSYSLFTIPYANLLYPNPYFPLLTPPRQVPNCMFLRWSRLSVCTVRKRSRFDDVLISGDLVGTTFVSSSVANSALTMKVIYYVCYATWSYISY